MQLRFQDNQKTVIAHFKSLKQAWRDASLFLDIQNFIVHIEHKKKHYTLLPQFITVFHNQKMQVMEFDDDIQRFIGWRPYTFRSAPLLTDKLAFKAWLNTQPFSVPQYSRDPSTHQNVILKNSLSSYSNLIRGPYRTASDCPFQLEKGDYFESYIEGTITKTWFWNDTPICIEKQPMPMMTGDGHATIKTLVERHLSLWNTTPGWEKIKTVLNYYGKELSTVLKAGEKQCIDFRYASQLRRPNDTLTVLCKNLENMELINELNKIGSVLWQNIISKHHTELLYSVDGILTNDDQLWILEANANPVVHPLTYDAMSQAMRAMPSQYAHA